MIWFRLAAVSRAARLFPLVPLFLLCASCSDFWVSNSSTASVSLGSGVILKAASSTTAADGESNQLHLYANTVGGTNTEVTGSATWTSSNTAVATVTSNPTPATGTPNGGLVQVVGTSGNVTVTITAKYQGQTATASVLTYTGAIPAVAITIPSGISSGALTPGQVFQLKATASPSLSGVANLDISPYCTWVSSNTSVATVDANGNVTVLSTASVNGTFSITATANFTTTVSSPAVQFTVI